MEDKEPPIPPPAKIDAALNISLRGDRLYEIDHLHKWFAISSLLLFAFTDVDDRRRLHQRVATVPAIFQAAERPTDPTGHGQPRLALLTVPGTKNFEGQLVQAEAEVAQNEAEVERIQAVLDDLDARLLRRGSEFSFCPGRVRRRKV